MSLTLTYHKGKHTLKQRNWKQPSILLFHRNLIWSKPIRQELPAAADGLEERGTKALSPLSESTVRCWESGHLVVTLHFFHCVRLLQATALVSSYWSGSTALNLCSFISPLLSSPLISTPLLSSPLLLPLPLFLCTTGKGMDHVVLYVKPDLSSCVGWQGQRLPSLGLQNALE